MNNDLISREALKEEIRREVGENQVGVFVAKRIFKLIDNVPTVDVSGNEYFPYRTAYFNGVEDGRATARSRGKWNYIQAGMPICPFCGATPHKNYKNFCPKCGADMRGGAE